MGIIQDKKIDSKEEYLAIKMLEKLGYKIIRPKKTKKTLTDNQLISYFYEELSKTLGLDLSENKSKNKLKDKSALEQFQKYIKRIYNFNSNGNVNYFLKEKHLQYFFKYYNILGSNTNVTNLYFLLSKRGNWLFKVVQDIKKQNQFQEVDEICDKICENLNSEVKKEIKKQKEELFKIVKKN